MPILTTLFRTDGVDIRGRTVQRTAVRGVIKRGEELLMVHSANIGDYKFPGGGVDEGETHAYALTREIEEECGVKVIRIGDEIGAVAEYNHAKEVEFDTFKMKSHYYRCEVSNNFSPQQLDGYERELGFTPVWLSIERALRQNQFLLDSEKSPAWLRRENFVLEYLLANQ